MHLPQKACKITNFEIWDLLLSDWLINIFHNFTFKEYEFQLFQIYVIKRQFYWNFYVTWPHKYYLRKQSLITMGMRCFCADKGEYTWWSLVNLWFRLWFSCAFWSVLHSKFISCNMKTMFHKRFNTFTDLWTKSNMYALLILFTLFELVLFIRFYILFHLNINWLYQNGPATWTSKGRYSPLDNYKWVFTACSIWHQIT